MLGKFSLMLFSRNFFSLLPSHGLVILAYCRLLKGHIKKVKAWACSEKLFESHFRRNFFSISLLSHAPVILRYISRMVEGRGVIFGSYKVVEV